MSTKSNNNSVWEKLKEIDHGKDPEFFAEMMESVGIKEGALLIDVGGAVGKFVKDIETEFGKKLRIYISELKERRGTPVDSRYKYLDKDAEHLSESALFKKELADIVLCSFTLTYTDKKRVLEEIKKILKPAGVLLLLCHAKNSSNFLCMEYAKNVCTATLEIVEPSVKVVEGIIKARNTQQYWGAYGGRKIGELSKILPITQKWINSKELKNTEILPMIKGYERDIITMKAALDLERKVRNLTTKQVNPDMTEGLIDFIKQYKPKIEDNKEGIASCEEILKHRDNAFETLEELLDLVGRYEFVQVFDFAVPTKAQDKPISKSKYYMDRIGPNSKFVSLTEKIKFADGIKEILDIAQGTIKSFDGDISPYMEKVREMEKLEKSERQKRKEKLGRDLVGEIMIELSLEPPFELSKSTTKVATRELGVLDVENNRAAFIMQILLDCLAPTEYKEMERSPMYTPPLLHAIKKMFRTGMEVKDLIPLTFRPTKNLTKTSANIKVTSLSLPGDDTIALTIWNNTMTGLNDLEFKDYVDALGKRFKKYKGKGIDDYECEYEYRKKEE